MKNEEKEFDIFRKKGKLFERDYPVLRQQLLNNWTHFKRGEAIKLIKKKAPIVYNFLYKNCFYDQRKIKECYIYSMLYYNKSFLCKVCGKPTNYQYDTKKFGDYCSKECVNKDESLWNKRRSTCKEKFGAENVFASDYGKQKIKEFWNKNYNVDNPSQVEIVKDKKRKTFQENWGADHAMKTEEGKEILKSALLSSLGVENPMFLEETKQKIINTNQKRRNVDWASQDPEVIEKTKKFWQENFGVDNPMYVPEIAEKCRINKIRAFSKREPIIIIGKTLDVQGFEGQVLKDLESKNLIKNLTNKVEHLPIIYYKYLNKKHRYYADCLIKLTRKNIKILLEVKSVYTLGMDLDKNIKKFRAANLYCKKNNMIFVLAIQIRPNQKLMNNSILYFLSPKNIRQIYNCCHQLENNSLSS